MQSKIFKDLQEHSYDLSLVISQFGYNNSADWLMIASGIKEINFVWNRYDKYSSWFCEPAMEYDEYKTDIVSNYIFNLTVFNYIWGALESFISKIFTKTQVKKHGKINCLSNILNSRDFPTLYYQYFKNEFYCLLKTILSDKYIDIKENYKSEIDIIYNIRNQFAHGTFKFPEAENYYVSANPNNMLSFIKISSRIVLFNIQALLILENKSKEIGLSLPTSFFENTFGIDDFDLITPTDYILSRTHFKNIPETDKFITLWDKEYFLMSEEDFY